METGLEIVLLPVGKIDPNPWNPNQQTDVVRQASKESLEQFGFVAPILVRPHPETAGRYEIVNGEHRHQQATELGYEFVPAVVRDLSDDDAKKLTVVLNETTGDPDVVLLGQLLSDLQHLDDFKLALPYTDAELEHLLAIGAQDDWDRYGQGGGAGEPGDPPGDPLEHDVVLSLSAQQLDLWNGWVKILRHEYGIDDLTALVVEAVRRAALDANQG